MRGNFVIRRTLEAVFVLLTELESTEIIDSFVHMNEATVDGADFGREISET